MGGQGSVTALTLPVAACGGESVLGGLRQAGEQCRGAVGERGGRERLMEEGCGGRVAGNVAAGDVEHREGGPARPQAGGQLDSGDAGHVYIGDYEAEGVGPDFGDAEGFETVVGDDDPVAGGREDAGHVGAQCVFVIHHQHERGRVTIRGGSTHGAFASRREDGCCKRETAITYGGFRERVRASWRAQTIALRRVLEPRGWALRRGRRQVQPPQADDHRFPRPRMAQSPDPGILVRCERFPDQERPDPLRQLRAVNLDQAASPSRTFSTP